MKKIYIFLLSGLMFVACTDDLDQAPISDPSAGNFYRNADEFEQAVNGVYNALNSHPDFQFWLAETRSDNIYSPGTSGVRDWNPINNFENTLATNPITNNAWNSYFRGVFRANTVLDKITPEIIDDPALYDRLVGETKFLRAVFYFNLVRLFGSVPLITELATPDEALNIGRTPVSEVYDQIIADLEDAINLLPDSYTGGDLGRATSHAAHGILARVYLTRSGPTYGIEGPGMASNEYAQAITHLDAIINSGLFAMEANYEDIFDYDNEMNPEIVFAIQNIDDGSGGNRGLGTILPTNQYLGGGWAQNNTNFPGGVDTDSPQRPSNDFFAKLDTPNDLRVFQAMILEFYDPVLDQTITDLPFYSKFLDLTQQPADRFNWPIDFPMLRYTDVLMMKAEALIQTGGSQATIDQIVNDVRTRAGLTGVSNVDLNMLLEERRAEFMAEGQRMHDLVRSGEALTIMNAWEAVDDVAAKVNPITADHLIYAIPQNQIDVKKGLYEQNPGY